MVSSLLDDPKPQDKGLEHPIGSHDIPLVYMINANSLGY